MSAGLEGLTEHVSTSVAKFGGLVSETRRTYHYTSQDEDLIVCRMVSKLRRCKVMKGKFKNVKLRQIKVGQRYKLKIN